MSLKGFQSRLARKVFPKPLYICDAPTMGKLSLFE